MNLLDEFISYLVGNFNNIEQYNSIKDSDKTYPYAEHVNTICNDKINNLPKDFRGYFMVEESYYNVGERKNSMSHLFLFTLENNKVKLTSYDLPPTYKKDFKYSDLNNIDYKDLHESSKFVPALYEYKNGCFKGGSVSMFNPTLKFTLDEEFTRDYLKVSEIMEVNGKRTFGFDIPILYKRIK